MATIVAPITQPSVPSVDAREGFDPRPVRVPAPGAAASRLRRRSVAGRAARFNRRDGLELVGPGRWVLAGFGTRGTVPTAATPEQVASITAPVLLIHGRDDRVVHFEHSLRLVAMIPDARLVLFNRCGHWAQLEHAEEFNRLVADFVDNA